MKLRFLTIAFALFCFTASAQFTFLDFDGNPIESGTTVSFGQEQIGDSDGVFKYFLRNDTAGDIFMKAENTEKIGAGSSTFEICFGLCYTGITEGQQFPNNGSVFVAGGAQTLSGNHLVNIDNNSEPMEFSFRFFQTDQAGTTEVGNEIFITYRYDPTLGVEDNTQIDFDITSTVIKDILELRTSEGAIIRIVDKSGREIKKKKIKPGTQRIPTYDLPSDLYFVVITNERNVSETVKVIKQ